MGPSLVLSAYSLNMGEWERDSDDSNDEEFKRNTRSTRSTTRWSTSNDAPAMGNFGSSPPGSGSQQSSMARVHDSTLQRHGYDEGVSSRYASHHRSPPFGYGITPNQASMHNEEEEEEDDEEEDDRKPAARPKPNAQHRDAFVESQEEESPPLETLTNPDQYINPSLSFGDDEEVMRQGDGNYEIDGLGIVADPSAVLESYAATRVPSYAPPLVYSIGGTPFHDLNQAAAAGRARTSALPVKRRNLDSCRRMATEEELATPAGTERARAAVMTWYDRFNELISYAEVHGDCSVPQKHPENPQLGIWVNKQRMEKKFMDEGKRTSMTAKRVEALESIGFVWAKRKGEASWMLKFTELQQYKQVHGNCDVATKYAPNPALGRWVSTQRSEYKILQRDGRSKHMTQSRVNMLNSLGFKWEMLLTNRTSPSSSNSSSSTGED